MTDELLFRIAVVGLWTVFLANLAWTRYLARVSVSQRVARHASWSELLALTLAVPYFGGTVLYSLDPISIAFLQMAVPEWFRIVMLGVAVVSVSFSVWGLRVLGRNWAPSMTGVRQDTTLVTNGPYRIVRNPIYSGILVSLPSLALVVANWLIFLPAVLLCAMLYVYVADEENTLIDHFGEAYREYMKRTPSLIPGLRRARAPPSTDESTS